jgi:hypothetical protein
VILGLRVSRRRLTGVSVDEGRVVFADSRYVPSKASVREASVRRYVSTLMDQTRPDALCVYAPTARADSSSELLVAVVQLEATQRQVPVLRFTKIEMLESLRAERSARRRWLSEQVRLFCEWPSDKITAPLDTAEAALAAYLGEIRHTLDA